MKKLFVALFIVAGFASCDKWKLQESLTTNWIPEKDILVEYIAEHDVNIYTVVDGENRLFEYTYGTYVEDAVDSDKTMKLVFAVNNEIDEFEFTDEELIEMNCFYEQFGTWIPTGQWQIKNGTIKGEKISENQWRINVSVSTTPKSEGETAKTIEFIEVFTLNN